MAQEADGAELPNRLAARRRQSGTEDKLPRGSSPADTLVSPRLWKHAVVGVACLIAWAAVLIIGARADAARTGLENIVGLSSGKLTTFFSTVMLLAAGQLAFINLWYRSRSRKDFNGSYKLWFWTALGWLTFCAVRASGAHWSLADAVLANRPVAVWNGRLILWMVPAAITFATLYALLRREMRDCRESLWTLRLSAVTALLSGLSLLFGPFVLETQAQLMAEAALGMGWHMLLACAMLLHARHVIHISNEPPQSELRRWSWTAWLSLFRRVNGDVKGRSSKSARDDSAADSAAPTRLRTGTKKKRTSTRRRTTTLADESVDDEVDETASLGVEEEADDEIAVEEQPGATVSARGVVDNGRPAPSAPQRRVDPPQPAAQSKPHFAAARPADVDEDPAENWNGSGDGDDADRENLSAKERKRLKKLQRQQARSSR